MENALLYYTVMQYVLMIRNNCEYQIHHTLSTHTTNR